MFIRGCPVWKYPVSTFSPAVRVYTTPRNVHMAGRSYIQVCGHSHTRTHIHTHTHTEPSRHPSTCVSPPLLHTDNGTSFAPGHLLPRTRLGPLSRYDGGGAARRRTGPGASAGAGRPADGRFVHSTSSGCGASPWGPRQADVLLSGYNQRSQRVSDKRFKTSDAIGQGIYYHFTQARP